MNTKYISDDKYFNSIEYQNFLKNNPGKGYLMIRSNAASGAIPIIGLKVIISKVINNDKVIFFEGETDSSGMIEKIELPAPLEENNSLEIPLYSVYKIEWNYPSNNLDGTFDINIYDKICTIQNIIISPSGGNYGY